MDEVIRNSVSFRQKTLNCGGTLLDLRIPAVMGILNLTGDSFYAGSRIRSDRDLLSTAKSMLEDGAAILDLGAMSTRPGAEEIDAVEERRVIVNAVRSIRKEFPQAILSVDTYRAKVAQSGLDEGVSIVNDISGFEFDLEMLAVLREYKPVYILMHNKAKPSVMREYAEYGEIIPEILGYFIKKNKVLRDAGLADVVIDPGFGFSKRISHNFEILRRLDTFCALENPLLAGISRKSMVYRTMGVSPDDALYGSSALHLYALTKGADILRVHDVKEAVGIVRIWRQLKER